MNKTPLSTLAALATLSLFAASSAFASTNLVTNGSFEDLSGSLNHGSWGEFTSLSGWTIASASKTSVFEIQQASEYSHVSGFNTHYDGTYYLELNSNNLGAITQTLSTTAGQTYTLSFGYADRSGSKNASSMDIYWNGTQLKPINTGDTNWKTYSYTVTATGASTALTFVSTGPVKDVTMGSYLDGVSVTAVPEPESYAMLLAGLGVMATIARRRSKATQA